MQRAHEMTIEIFRLIRQAISPLINPQARTVEIVQAEHMAEVHQPDPNPALPSIEEVLSDFAASDWLKKALRSALDRDVVDAANDAEVLAQLLNARCCRQ